MTTNGVIIIFLSVIIGVLINLFTHRDKTYVVFLKNIETGVNFTVVVKSLSKRKVYETVSKYLIEEGEALIITDATNTNILDNNSIVCSNIYINKK